MNAAVLEPAPAPGLAGALLVERVLWAGRVPGLAPVVLAARLPSAAGAVAAVGAALFDPHAAATSESRQTVAAATDLRVTSICLFNATGSYFFQP